MTRRKLKTPEDIRDFWDVLSPAEQDEYAALTFGYHFENVAAKMERKREIEEIAFDRLGWFDE